MSDIVIIDCGIGNTASVANMFRRVGHEVLVSADTDEVLSADKLVLPGVGAFDYAMHQLDKLGLAAAIGEVAEKATPILGICLGMQLLFERSEEGQLPGLGLVPGYVKRFSFEDDKLKIPHMGWNIVCPTRNSSLFTDNEQELRFYHVHSYHAVCESNDDVTAVTHYGYDFTSAIERNNVMGVQFHPEKSHRFGMDLIKEFTEI